MQNTLLKCTQIIGSDFNFLKLSRCLSMALPLTGPSNPPCSPTIPAAVSVWNYLWLCKTLAIQETLFPPLMMTFQIQHSPNSSSSQPFQTLTQPLDQFSTIAGFARKPFLRAEIGKSHAIGMRMKKEETVFPDDYISNLKPPVHPVHSVHPSHLLTQPLAQFGTLCKKQSSLL